MADGILNRAQIADTLTEITAGIDFYNEQDRQWDAMLCNRTYLPTVRVMQRSMSYRPVGESGTPENQRIFYQDIALPEPMRYGLKDAITQMAMEDGLDRDTIMAQHAEAMKADGRWVTQVCLRAMLLDGGWWDASATPPTYQNNTFQSTHDHYLGYNVGGTPALAHFTAIERHIQEHGFGLAEDGGVVAFMNGNMAQRITNSAEWATAPGPMATSVMDRLQQLGVTPGFRAAGVLCVKSDWVPDYYITAFALNQKPLHWRMPRGLALNAGVMTWQDAGNVRTWENIDYIRRGSAAVTKRGAGVAVYFNNATWTNPTLPLDR